MSQDYIIFISLELFVFCILIYLLIRANIFVNSLQQEVNELNLYLPSAIREVRSDVIKLNKSITEHFSKDILNPQEIGFFVGKIFVEILLLRLKPIPFKNKFILVTIMNNLWKIRTKLKTTFLCSLFKK